VKKYLDVMAVQLRMSVLQALAYRADFVIEGTVALAAKLVALLPLLVLFDQRTTFQGWDRTAALMVMSYFIIIRAVMEGMVSPSVQQLADRIRTGSFDYVLLKPIDAQFLASSARTDMFYIYDLLYGVLIGVYALYDRGTWPSPANVGLGLALLVTGVLAMYALWILCAAAAFWIVRLDSLIAVVGVLYDAARWPVQVFGRVWRTVFTYVIPLALMTTFPSMAILGRLDGATAAATVGGTLGLLVVSRIVWRLALRSYTSASS
jgi:ABC-2 type transport system permease protein